MASLRVRDWGSGPIVHVRWRHDRTNVERPIGPGWLVEDGKPGAKPNGRTVGRWRERRGRVPDGFYGVDDAREQVPVVLAAWEAEQAREAAQAKREAGEGLSLRAAADRFIEWGKTDDPHTGRAGWKYSYAKNTEHYVNRLVRELGEDTPLASVTGDDLKALMAKLKPMRNGKVVGKPTTKFLKSYADPLRGLFDYAENMGWIIEDPADVLPSYKPRGKRADDPLRREEYLTANEVRAVLGKVAGEQDRVMLMVMALAGLRPGEAAALKWQDVDHERAVVRIVESRTMSRTDKPKSGSGRSVPMAPELAQALAALSLRENHTRPRDLVFPGTKAEHVDIGGLRQRFEKSQKAAKIDPPRELRQLRNTMATNAASAGIPLRTLQEWLGHASIVTTERYASFQPRHEDAAKLGQAFSTGPVGEAEKALVEGDDEKVQAD